MKIALDNRITYNNDKAFSRFSFEFWKDVAISQPHHHFILITADKKTGDLPSNFSIQQFEKPFFQWLEQKKFTKIITEWQADKLVTMQENGFTITTIQHKKNTGEAQQKKQVLFAGSANNDSNIVLPALPNPITALTWAETESIKTEYTGGRSYFLFIGSVDEPQQLIDLLKAFSLFKKWQQSNMQLVIACNNFSHAEVIEEKLASYKYKDDVILLKKISDETTAKLVAASYALVCPSSAKMFPFQMLWAVQAGKAIVATDNVTNRQLADCALWVEQGNTTVGFAKAMIALYKDENQLQLLVQQTKNMAANFNRRQMIADAWQYIEQ